MSEVPELSDDEAAVLDYHDRCSAWRISDATCRARAKGLLTPHDRITVRGRAALAAFDAAERAKIVAPMLRLLIEAQAVVEVSDLSGENQRETIENGAFHGYQDRRDAVLDAIRELIAKESGA